MNNSFLENPDVELTLEEPSQDVQERIGELTALIEASGRIRTTEEWSTLKKVLDGEIGTIERLQKLEMNKSEVNLPELYRLQGRLTEARYHSLSALEEKWRAELLNLRKL
mgnify:CR=1 FL=1